MNRSRSRDNGFPLSRDLRPHMVDPRELRPLGEATRDHPPKQIRKIVRSIFEFGFVYPAVVDEKGRVVGGWSLVLAAREMRLPEMPVVTIVGLSEGKARTLRLALNRLAEDSRWDRNALRREFAQILEIENDIEIADTGFEMAEIDSIVLDDGSDEEDELPSIAEGALPVSRLADQFVLGEHRIICADARDAQAYATLLDDERAQMGFADPPYNVPIDGHASGLGATKHEDFVMACGELSPQQFEAFLRESLALAARHSMNGAIQFCCMDWRGMEALFAATKDIYSELKNLCIWNKTNAGMGSLYRSKHELIFVFKIGKGPHINNVALGRYGRNRANVFDYAGQTSLRGRKSKLSLHATVKPVALVADTIRDCSNRGGIILDPFAGAGTTLIAAQKTGRRARLIELDPKYVDVTIRRWQRLSGEAAVHAETGRTFDELAREREADHVG